RWSTTSIGSTPAWPTIFATIRARSAGTSICSSTAAGSPTVSDSPTRSPPAIRSISFKPSQEVEFFMAEATSDTLLDGTRKGLLVHQRSGDTLKLADDAFVGAQVTWAMAGPRNGWWWDCLNHGLWGVKLHRSRNHGKDWE